MLYLAYVLQFVVDSLYDGPFPEQYLVVEVHERVLHVLPDFRDQVYVVDEEHLEEVLADVSPVREKLPEESFRELSVPERVPVVDIARREHPLDDLPPVVDDEVQLEPVEPSHRALALRGPSPHGPVLPLALDVAGGERRGVDDGDSRALALRGPSPHGPVLPLALDVAGGERRGVDDGDSRALAQGAGLLEQQQVRPDLRLALHEAVAVTLAGNRKGVFFQLRLKILAELVENTENFH